MINLKVESADLSGRHLVKVVITISFVDFNLYKSCKIIDTIEHYLYSCDYIQTF